MLKETGSLACFNILCQMFQILCGVFDAGCRNSVLFLAVLKCLFKKAKENYSFSEIKVRVVTCSLRIPLVQRNFLNLKGILYLHAYRYTLLCKAR